MTPHNTLAVIRFELRRTLTLNRMGVWFLLVLFPIFITSVMKYYEPYFQGEVVLVKSQELPIDLPGQGRVSFQLIDGRRVATLYWGEQGKERVYRDIVIPRHLSREEVSASIEQLIELHDEQSQQPAVNQDKIDDTVWGVVLSGLIPGVITLLGLLLWATPIVQAELEGRTWIYLAVRPRGRASVLLGKYFTAVVWTATAGWVSALACIAIAKPHYPWQLGGSLALIITFSCFGYGALYALIGVLIQRRAMVIAVAYTLILEFLVSFVPAVINQFTVHYRLRNLFVQFMGWRELIPDEAGEVLLGDQPAWLHIVVLTTMTLTLILVAMQMIQRKEYVSAEEV